jgi:hypothetical protein
MSLHEPTLDMPCPTGANYLPARAGNAYRFWTDYDPETIERDLSYAQKLRLSALRIPLSFHAWADGADELAEKLEHFLETAREGGMKVLPYLFEAPGLESTRERRAETDPVRAVALCEPGVAIIESPSGWNRPRGFVDWFMKRYANDLRLQAIEIVNEPDQFSGGIEGGIVFAREMLQHANRRREGVPLTMGCADLRRNSFFLDVGLDVLQWHMSFPDKPERLKRCIVRGLRWQRILGKPVWLTEWQRLRPGGSGWGGGVVAPGEDTPDYASLAPLVQRYPHGHFFYSLMVKPAYHLQQRAAGSIGGVFHEDGAVWSLEDARMLAGDDSLELEERPRVPDWAQGAGRKLRDLQE